ncbi:MAG: hypothetical protein C0506_15150 [Anaerolinea sp.]|nr:hypothetical protein [Anaerolinea sp.]
MKNPFASEVPASSPEDEAAAAGLFSPIGEVAPSDDALARIRGTMANALSATLAARPANTTMRRVAFTSAAVTAPLMAVSAVGAITGNEPLAGPIDFVSNAVGLTSAETPAAGAGTPVASPSADASPPAPASASASASTTPEAAVSGQSRGATAAEDAHTNEKGCDDVNPAVQGTPTPGGPVDCETGNSAEHRQNGKEHGKPTSTATATADPSASPPAEDEQDEDEAAENDKGSVSRGLGLGHEKGNGLGHEKHGHEPNENGNGPPRTATAEPSPAAAGTPVPSRSGPGAGGNANPGQGNGNAGQGGSNSGPGNSSKGGPKK